MIIVVQDFLLRVLALLDIDDADLELGLDEDLVKLHQLLAGVRQLTEGEWGVQVDLPTQTRHHLQHDITNLFYTNQTFFVHLSRTSRTPILFTIQKKRIKMFHLLPVVAVGKDTGGRDESMDGVTNRSHQDPENISSKVKSDNNAWREEWQVCLLCSGKLTS